MADEGKNTKDVKPYTVDRAGKSRVVSALYVSLAIVLLACAGVVYSRYFLQPPLEVREGGATPTLQESTPAPVTAQKPVICYPTVQTAQNAKNGGIVAFTERRTYLADPQGGIIEVDKADGGKRLLLPDVQADSLCIVGDWLYFSDKAQKRALCRMRMDTQEVEKLKIDCASYIQPYGDRLYYAVAPGADELPRQIWTCGQDGADAKMLYETTSFKYFCVLDGDCYYVLWHSLPELHRLSGGDDEVICKFAVQDYAFWGRRLLVISDGLKSVDMQGGDVREIEGVEANNMYSLGMAVYFANAERNGSLYVRRFEEPGGKNIYYFDKKYPVSSIGTDLDTVYCLGNDKGKDTELLSAPM